MNPPDFTIDPYRQQLSRLIDAAIRISPVITTKLAEEASIARILDDLTVGAEQPYLLLQTFMWLIRGASIDDIKRHAATGNELPFEGGERAMYSALFDSLAQRSDRAHSAQVIAETATHLDEVLTMLQEESELTRDDILVLIGQKQRTYVQCSRCCELHSQGALHVRAE